VQRQASEAAYDAGFRAGVDAGVRFNLAMKRKLTWCWWVAVLEAVLLAAAVANVGVAWFLTE
jgi:hypothetical protein